MARWRHVRAEELPDSGWVRRAGVVMRLDGVERYDEAGEVDLFLRRFVTVTVSDTIEFTPSLDVETGEAADG